MDIKFRSNESMMESLSPNLNDPSVHIPKFTNDRYSSTMGFYTVTYFSNDLITKSFYICWKFKQIHLDSH
jgi:hypothetical protein